MEQNPHQSPWQAAVQQALINNDPGLLQQLVQTESPTQSLFELTVQLNQMYSFIQNSPPELRNILPNPQGIIPYIDWAKDQLHHWELQATHLSIMQYLRRVGALSVVLGAGATMAAGGPSWSKLIEELLEIALNIGHEITQMIETEDSTADSRKFERQVVDVENFDPADKSKAKNILKLIKGGKADTEDLMQGAQLCLDLFGQYLFMHLTKIIYDKAPEPSEIHRAVAELAEYQLVKELSPEPIPGWETIITYNFDGLMNEALLERKIPHAVRVTLNKDIETYPDELAKQMGGKGNYLEIHHLHGYTPKKLFNITDIRYVFSTNQYLQEYADEKHTIKEVYYEYLRNPLHYAVYVGCSFDDEYMNGLLQEAFQQFPGRYHYAFLLLPEEVQEKTITNEDIQQISAKYLEFGVQPIWLYDYDEIPDRIRYLK